MLFALAGIILCGLKIAGVTIVATWPWWLVTLPFWIGIAMFFAMLLIGGGLFALAAAFIAWVDRK
ncbi:hypothetical protein BZM27_05930 [Paraburkholderia steynii]|uniref:Uncharacterized protein n=1 Tax=Paraburkholderia steynii TaxID=1245441 RepID=A0A4R0XPJ2_9BURK|nr:hypothetical protein BZM27_05930 [Paraburkholderia steynii]